ncbi:CBF/Mak21 family-domain-containing protein [Dichotomopilus funicola]|uniref:CBF/Mak21 family-domain-containing protein n=1 Tax=Dichotomopilus funicola TaxID=1934379 RepID=A0AAN6ZLW6_9PEZI|nr:CBF/Mak21 family-domain-containing protein [Dichotomopilus funicola]
MRIKQGHKSKGAANPSFDETALAHITNQIDQSLAQSREGRLSNQKRQLDNDEKYNSKKSRTRPSERSSTKQTPSLLGEIIALGGDEDDLKLVANVDSGDEGGGAPRPISTGSVDEDNLKSELAQFASNLGFSKFYEVEDPETDEDLGSEGEDEGQAGEQEEDDDEEENEEKEGGAEEAGDSIFEPRHDWHKVSVEGLSLGAPGNNTHHSRSISSLKTHAERLLEQDSLEYSARRASSSTQKFMSTIMSSGTLSDKISALTLSIQESPLHNRKSFDSLVTLAGKRSRGQAIAALGALVDLLGNGAMLPSDRRLHVFNMQPLLLGALDSEKSPKFWSEGQRLPGKLTSQHLMMWAFEDWLKGAYFRIIQLLEVWCSDEIEYSRSRALDFVFGLLKDKPEQEANLLRLLVNKLGDRERKISSRASYLLLQLLNLHPGMKAIVINTLEEELLLKPGQSMRVRYTCANTLNQIILSTKEPAIADTLLRIYFEMFHSLLRVGSLGDFAHAEAGQRASRSEKKPKSKGLPTTGAQGNEQETVQKLVSSLLTGVNRAVPFAGAEDSTIEKHLDTLFRVTHSSNFNTSIQALMLIQQLTTSKQLAVDRFYRTLYESLLDPRLITSSKHALYLNLLFRAMKNDVDVRRVRAFVKRLTQILSLHQPSFVCGILFLIAELHTTFPDLHTLLDDPEDGDDDGDEVYQDIKADDTQGDAQPKAQSGAEAQRRVAYDGRKRDPKHSNAHRSCLWELVPFLSHYHPSVCVFANNLLARQKRLPRPDLANHTLMHFLDRFVYRSPKGEESKRGGSIMQPILASGGASRIVAPGGSGAERQPTVNVSSFWNLRLDQVSPEDVFFHEYFARVGKPGEVTRTTHGGVEEGNEAGPDDEADGEAEIWDALVSSRPEIEGVGVEEDADMDLEEFNYSDNEMEADDAGFDGWISDSEGSGDFEGIFDDDSDGSGDAAVETHGDELEDGGEEENEESRLVGPGLKSGNRGRLNRKEMRSLPTFASAEDYAEMLAAEYGLDD